MHHVNVTEQCWAEDRASPISFLFSCCQYTDTSWPTSIPAHPTAPCREHSACSDEQHFSIAGEMMRTLSGFVVLEGKRVQQLRSVKNKVLLSPTFSFLSTSNSQLWYRRPAMYLSGYVSIVQRVDTHSREQLREEWADPKLLELFQFKVARN